MADTEILFLEIASFPTIGETPARDATVASVSGDDLEPGGSYLDAEKGKETKGGGTGGMRSKNSYSRGEMEALRFVDVGEQRRRWKEVCERLSEVVAREYDGLHQPNPKKQKCGSKKKKKGEAPPVVGEVFAATITQTLDFLDLSDHASRDSDVAGESNPASEELCYDYGSMNVEDNISNGDSYPEFEYPSCGYGSMNNEDNLRNEEYDSSDDDYSSIQRPAFFVEGEPDLDSGPPLDGLEYLRRVRWEAAQIPKVKVAKLSSSKQMTEQTPYMPKLPEIPKCPPHLLPSRDWEENFLANFQELREAFSRHENSCYISRHDEKHFGVLECTQKPKSMPTMTLIGRMDPVSRAATLRNYISMFEGATAPLRDDCLWLFALCAVVDTPLDGSTCASLRSLLRKCSSILSEKSEPDDEVAMLNILIAIAGKYFGQSERT